MEENGIKNVTITELPDSAVHALVHSKDGQLRLVSDTTDIKINSIHSLAKLRDSVIDVLGSASPMWAGKSHQLVDGDALRSMRVALQAAFAIEP